MSDNAELGFSVDTADLDKAVKALDSMEAAAGRAGAAGSKMAHDFVPGLEQTAHETLRAESAGQKYIKAMQLQYDILGKNGAEIAALRAKYSGFSDDVVRQAAEIGKKTDAWKREEQAARDAAKAEEQAFRASASTAGDAKKNMEGFSLATAGASRELIVLFHEAMTGNVSKMPGSFVVLMERAGGLHTALSALMSPIGMFAVAGVAAFAAVGYQIYQGYSFAHDFKDALQATNGALGITRDQAEALAQSFASNGVNGAKAYRNVLLELAQTGTQTSGTIGGMTRAIVDYADLTGKDANQVVGDFAKMGDGVFKWAAEHNKQMHFVTASQLEMIKNLEDMGDKERSMQLVSDALHSQMGNKDAKNIGVLTMAWRGWGIVIDEVNAKLMHIGMSETVNEKVDRLSKKLAEDGQALRSAPGDEKGLPKIAAQKRFDEDRALLLAALKQQGVDLDQSLEKEASAKTAAAAADILALRTTSRTKAQIREEEHKALEAKFKDPGLLSGLYHGNQSAMDAEFARFSAAIDERNKDKKPAREHVDQGIKHEYQEIARAAAMAAEAKAKLNQLNEPDNDKAAKVTPAEAAIFKLQAELLTPQKYRQGQEGDSGIHRAIAEYEKVVPLQRQYMALEEQRKEQKKQQQKEEKQQEDVERWGRKTGAQWQNSDATDLSKMAAEREMIGQSADAKKIYNAQLKIERDYQAAVNSEAAKYGDAKLTEKENIDAFIEKYPLVIASLQKEADIRRQTLIPAMKEQGEAQRTWQYGAQESWAKYRDSASNDALAASSIFNAGVDGMQSGLMNFFETGKLGWKEFATSALKEIERIMIAKAIAGLVGSVFGGFAAGAAAPGAAPIVDATPSWSYTPSAAGGYDIPAGVNPVTQLHEKEMVLPAEHAEVIRGLSSGQTGAGAGASSGQPSVIQHFYITTDGKTTQSGDSTAGGGNGVVKLAEMMKSVALQVITQEMRPGGAIYNQKAA